MRPRRKPASAPLPVPDSSNSAAMDGDTEEMSDVNESSGDQNVDDQIHSTDTHSSVNDDDNDDNDGDDDDDGEEDNDSDESSDLVDSDSDSDDMHAMLDYSSDEALDNTEAIPVPLPDELAELAAGRDDGEGNGDDDDVVQAILRAREKHRNHPPAIECEDGVSSLSFHPEEQLIAIGTFTGDVLVYGYSDEACELKYTHELHMKSIRDVEFSKDGKSLISCSKDKSILMADAETGKLTQLWDQAHTSPVHTLYILDENRFCSGCEEGYVKLWDKRKKDSIFSLRAMEDIVTAMVSTPQNKHLAVACGGTITSINLNARKIQVQSEEYEHDFTCLGLFRHDSKLLAGSSKGTMYVFNWGEFGLHCEEFTGSKQPVTCLLPVTETVAVTGWEDGKLRATHLFPHQPLGIVGQHDFEVECLDISNDGTLVASAAAAGGHIKFWNIKYIEEVKISCQKKKKRKSELNLPSSTVRNRGDFFSGLAGPS
ncbi:WD repeat-containing protein 55 homolog [Frankliniella occidentalis]|uniref:WD repeat-containing protein 55 homolog n=1 Tax=Frankliniella occidentalis TaxID=133901 RepID=A0A9C6U2T9_FRAOC|nr:WD repeat-containing protein 55 homolog [Frankliniella occidentalis]XP_052122081.1 WD repeat-containing protein 55 homolog [Frankliniella occidentalis]XP_052122082.1 WD repeat-containing protein 55 homolog [Frankliniella occidentalis]